MTEKPQIKHFNLIVSGDQIQTSGNMSLNEVASALIDLAANAGIQRGMELSKE